jgi:hypothetical protein
VDLQKINIKFFVAEPNRVSLDSFVDVFHSWIQASDGEYYDIADYGHVPAGPGIVLVADKANISIDNNENRIGLLYNGKRPLDGSNREKLAASVRSALTYCRRLEDEPSLEGRVRFRGEEAVVIINDRLIAPNTDETFSALRADIEALATRLFGQSEFTLERESDPRRRFGVRIRAATPLTTKTLLENLQQGAN